MLPLTLYNSLTKKREVFTSLEPGKVKLYNCGPTVYKRPHVGNLRRFLFADFLRRTLELFGYEVRDITNITDVGHLTQDDLDTGEDKLEREAAQHNVTPQEIAERVTKHYFADLAALNIQPAHKYPRATAHINEMQDLIAELLRRGHAYTTNDGVYYDVQSFPNYGKLSGNTLDKVQAGARVLVRENKKHPADFALWKTNDPQHLQQWDSPWGRGYPGWHVECSAMSMAYLGPRLDIHTGGEDNKFPHHENEIAQSEGATHQTFSRFWLHNGFLQWAGAKMAKRAGEQLTLDSLAERGYPPLTFRLLVFGSHYRSPMNFSWMAMDGAQENFATLRQLLRRVLEMTNENGDVDSPVEAKFVDALADDLNTPEALAAVMYYAHQANTMLEGAEAKRNAPKVLATLRKMDSVLGIFLPLEHELLSEKIPAAVQKLATEREAARKKGDFTRADELRAHLENQGFILEDTPTGPRVLKKSLLAP